MASRLEDLRLAYERKGDNASFDAILRAQQVLNDAGVIDPKDISPILEPDFSHDIEAVRRELARQTEIYLKVGVHHAVEELPEVIMERVFDLARLRPEEFGDSFPIPLVVMGKLPLPILSRISGVKIDFPESVVADFKRPDESKDLYLIWMQDGTKNQGEPIRDVRYHPSNNEYGATVREGLSLLVTHPTALRHHDIALPGSYISSFDNATVPLLKSRPDRSVSLEITPDVTYYPRLGTATVGIPPTKSA